MYKIFKYHDSQAAIGASNILKERLDPVKEKHPDSDWKELVVKALESKVDLSAKYTLVYIL